MAPMHRAGGPATSADKTASTSEGRRRSAFHSAATEASPRYGRCSPEPQLRTKSALHVGQSLLAGALVAGVVGFACPRHSRCDRLHLL